MDNKETIHERITKLVETFGDGKNTVFASLIDEKEANIRGYRTGIVPKYQFFEKIASNLEINMEWLITGKGEMIKQKGEKVILPTKKTTTEEETRPRIPMDAAAGSLTIAADGVTFNDCERFPIIKAFPRYDFTIFARGDSMEPEYHSGDELACVHIKHSSFIQWGRVHVIDTEQGILVKRIFDGGDCIICKSDNPNYPDFPINRSEFYNIALVIGAVRRY